MSPAQMDMALAIMGAAKIPVLNRADPDFRTRAQRLNDVEAPYCDVRDDNSNACDCGPVLYIHIPVADCYRHTTWLDLWAPIERDHIAFGELDPSLAFILDRINNGDLD